MTVEALSLPEPFADDKRQYRSDMVQDKYSYSVKGPMPLDDFCKWPLDPRKRLCHMNASLSKSSISFSVHPRVGRDCRNIITS